MMNNLDTKTLIRKWRNIIAMARENSANEQSLVAICHYKKAKKIALILFNQWREPEQTINILLTSYSDLSHFYQSKNQHRMAELELIKAHEMLLMSLNYRSNDYSHKHILLNGIIRSYTKLRKHLNKYASTNSQPSTSLYLQRI